MTWTVYKVAALILLSALSKGELPEDDFRIINRQGKGVYLYYVVSLHFEVMRSTELPRKEMPPSLSWSRHNESQGRPFYKLPKDVPYRGGFEVSILRGPGAPLLCGDVEHWVGFSEVKSHTPGSSPLKMGDF